MSRLSSLGDSRVTVSSVSSRVDVLSVCLVCLVSGRCVVSGRCLVCLSRVVVSSVCLVCRARVGPEKSGGKRKRQRGSKLSNKQEKAKGKGQESRHQNGYPPFFLPWAHFACECNRSRSLFGTSKKSKLIVLIVMFFARRLAASFRQVWRCRLWTTEPVHR